VTAAPTPAGERYDLRTLPAQPWKNGAGLTREIAVDPRGADMSAFDWRISVAEVDRDAPFSAFPAIDRCIVLLEGAGMHLAGRDGVLALERPFEPLCFAGELALAGRLIDGPCRDFNVMTRRGAWRSDVVCIRDTAVVDGADASLVHAGSGRWRVGDDTLEAGQGLCWRTATAALPVRPLAGGTLLHVRLFRMGTR